MQKWRHLLKLLNLATTFRKHWEIVTNADGTDLKCRYWAFSSTSAENVTLKFVTNAATDDAISVKTIKTPSTRNRVFKTVESHD